MRYCEVNRAKKPARFKFYPKLPVAQPVKHRH